jgi:mono/diheme cytochrome c family protein
MNRRLLISCGLLMALAAAALAVVPASLRTLLWHWEKNPVLRGRLLAEEIGCLNCHRPPANVEIPNPGSRWGTVPRFQTGNFMMYGNSGAELEEFIRFGAPRAWLEDPRAMERLTGQRLRMPAYGDRLSDTQIEDLVAWAAAQEGVELPGDEAAAAGRRLARQHGCLSCHGVEGSGGLPNPGSLGGFIPGFAGRNFGDLVQDEAEFHAWVLEGTSSRLESKPWVRFFWERQEISMPAYKDELSDEEVGQLWAWVQALGEG